MITYNTLLLVKPDGINRKIIGEIISMLEHNFFIKEFFFIKFDKYSAEEFYIEHVHKDFYEELVNFIISDRVLVVLISGDEHVFLNVRKFVGNTDFRKADANSIRGRFASSLTKNVVHASDSVYSYFRELEIISKILL